MIVKYHFKGYADQAALPDEYQTLMNASIEAVDGDIVLKLNNFLLEEGGGYIIANGPQNFIYAFSYTYGEGHGSNRENILLLLAWVEPPNFLVPIKACGYHMASRKS